MKTRGQGAIELLILLCTLLFFFILVTAEIYWQAEKKHAETDEYILREIALSVQNELALASKSSDGYSRNFLVTSNAVTGYSINITEGLVFIETNKYTISYPVNEVIGNVKKGENTIKKRDGKVYLN